MKSACSYPRRPNRALRFLALSAAAALSIFCGRAHGDSRADRKAACGEKLDLTSRLCSTAGFAVAASTLNHANSVGYPNSTLGYVWCGFLPDGIGEAQVDVDSVEMHVAPYLDESKLPMSVGEVDELSKNNLESKALASIVSMYNPSDFQSPADFEDLDKARVEASYEWSGAGSIAEKKAVESDSHPEKTSLMQIIDASGEDWTGKNARIVCGCGIDTTDFSKEQRES